MKKILYAACAVTTIIIFAMAIPASHAATPSWETEGVIPGTEIEYSGLSITRSGVSVKLTNTSAYDVKVSLRLTFFSRDGNSIGYSLFGLREIWAENSVNITNNFLNGNWRACRDSPRMNFTSMTYEYLYD